MKWWLRCVGGVYVIMALLAAVLRIPIKALAPPGTLDQANAGEPVAQLLVDSWVTLGLEYVAVGAALLVASRRAERAAPLVWAVLALEVVRGIGTDVYMIGRGYAVTPHVVWIVVHAAIIGTGLTALSRGYDRVCPATST